MNNDKEISMINMIDNLKSKKIIEKCAELDISVSHISSNPQILELNKGTRKVYLYKQHLPLNPKNAVLLANHKHVTKTILRFNGINAPKGIIAKDSDDAIESVKEECLSYPLVAKPVDGSCGVGITVGIADQEGLLEAIEKIKTVQGSTKMLKETSFIIEEMVMGKDYRVLVLNGKVIACVERQPAHVIGDGVSSVEALVNSFNDSRPSQFQIVLDKEAVAIVQYQGFSVADVPMDGERIQIRKNANISMGGVPVDMTEKISERFKDICVRSASCLGLNFAGIDLFVADASSEDEMQPYGIIEVNGNLIDYDIHEKPLVQGKGVDVTKLILKALMD